jgi:MFS family permease
MAPRVERGGDGFWGVDMAISRRQVEKDRRLPRDPLYSPLGEAHRGVGMAVGDLDGAAPYLPLRKVVAVGLGNALEFYDFLTYSFFAIQIGHCFFPDSATHHGLLLSLATFGVGFVTRPLGGWLIGRLGDRVGRKPAMMLSFALMGGSIVALALIPSYAEIGIAAPILLVLCRLVQGFALGGEVGPSTAYLIEAAPPHRRGLYVALQYMTQDLAVLAAGLVGFILANLLDADALDAWGWRLALLIGAAVVPVGLWVRRGLPETLPTKSEGPTARIPVRLAILGLLMLMATSICIYGIDYITTFAQDSLHLAAGAAFGATVVTGLCSVIADPISGLLSDRVGRKPVMIGAVVILILVLVPSFWAMTRLPNVAIVYGATAILATLQAFVAAPGLILITESLPRSIRASGVGILYAVAIAAFGGTTQFMVKYLTDATGSPLAPAWYLSVAVAIGAVAMALSPETAPTDPNRRPRAGSARQPG